MDDAHSNLENAIAPAALRSKINLRAIWHLIVVSEQRSFHRAANVIGTDQSVVSRRIRALEDELGVSLFERDRAGVRLTTAGKEFVSQAKTALCDLDYAVKSARSAGRGSSTSGRPVDAVMSPDNTAAAIIVLVRSTNAAATPTRTTA